jgi:cytoskeletal protein CcmA (bactofilin family)
MALFNKEPEKNPKVQPGATPTASSSSSSSSSQSVASSSSVTPPAPALSPAAAPVRATPAPAAQSQAYLDRGSKVSGKLSFEGTARIDGEVDGEIIGKEGLTIGESAVITAQIRATSVTVSGKVSGDITATQRIEIRASAKVNGNITAPVLVVQEGALFEGHCSMQPEAREDRKVTVFPVEERTAQAAGGHKSA